MPKLLICHYIYALFGSKLPDIRIIKAYHLSEFGGDPMPIEADVDYRREYEKEQERLTKLWDAYAIQEKDFEQAKEKIKVLEDVIEEKDRIIQSLRQVAENRDSDIREMEVTISSLERENHGFEPKLKEMEKELKKQKDQFSKLYSLAEELDEELRYSRKQIELRDDWFRDHINVFSGMCNAISSREEIAQKTALKPTVTSPKSEFSSEIEM
jgi:chromosome segregation ATPase